MRLLVSGKGDNTYLYIVKSFRINGKSTTKVIENCGKLIDLQKQYDDPIEYFKAKANEMTEEEKNENSSSFLAGFKRQKLSCDKEILLNGGYLFLRKIYSALHLDYFMNRISQKYKIKYDLNKILEDLIYSRVIFPGSKQSSFEDSKSFLEKGDYELHDVYRALTVLNEWFDEIQAFVYKQSTKIVKRNTKILYFDCTNFFFEIEKEDNYRKYGISKEHRPNPLVQMGLFMDGNGVPLAIDINPGNTNEQITLRPFEEKVIKDFNLSKMIVCTDAGLASYSNREFNDIQGRGFIVTQSIKKLASHLKDWCLDLSNFTKSYGKDNEKVLYKSRPIKEDLSIQTDTPLGTVKLTKEWNLVVTYSEEYANYQKRTRDQQIKRAKELIKNPTKFNKVNAQDCKRFIKNISFDSQGEIVTKSQLIFDDSIEIEEERYDGFYAISTNLDADPREIVEINKQRWEIEESFRIMKTDLRSRPVFVSLEEHINAHFLTCFLALLFVRLIEVELNHKHKMSEIIESIKKIQYTDIGVGYMSSFKMTPCIQSLISDFQIECDYNSYTPQQMRKVINSAKSEVFTTSKEK